MILTKEQFDKQWDDGTLNTVDWFDTTWDLFVKLEEATKPKYCNECEHSWEPNNQTFHKFFCNYLQRPVHGNFYCNRYKQKEGN